MAGGGPASAGTCSQRCHQVPDRRVGHDVADPVDRVAAVEPAVSLNDVGRQPHTTPCPDCGRTYINGENVTWTVPAPDGGFRTVWSGCCDCWLIRTRPGGGR